MDNESVLRRFKVPRELVRSERWRQHKLMSAETDEEYELCEARRASA